MIMSGYDFLKSQVLSCWRKVESVCDVVIQSTRRAQTLSRQLIPTCVVQLMQPQFGANCMFILLPSNSQICHICQYLRNNGSSWIQNMIRVITNVWLFLLVAHFQPSLKISCKC